MDTTWLVTPLWYLSLQGNSHDDNNTQQSDDRSQIWSQCSVYARHPGFLKALWRRINSIQLKMRESSRMNWLISVILMLEFHGNNGRRKRVMRSETLRVNAFVCFINRIRVMRYRWGTDSANKRKRGKTERAAHKNREVDWPEIRDWKKNTKEKLADGYTQKHRATEGCSVLYLSSGGLWSGHIFQPTGSLSLPLPPTCPVSTDSNQKNTATLSMKTNRKANWTALFTSDATAVPFLLYF